MNRKSFYSRRRTYRVMLGYDNHEWGDYPSDEQGKYWSGMRQYAPVNQRWENTGEIWERAKYRITHGFCTKEEEMARAKDRFKKRYEKVKLP